MTKISPVKTMLDISEHIVPLSLPEVFGNYNELVLEIGFGDGDFLIEMAERFPEKNFLGIEIKTKRFNIALKKSKDHKYNNLKFLHMNANIAIEEIFRDGTFSLIYINFPDPWPKDRHHKHRIVNREFLSSLSEIMRDDGVLEIASDHRDYISHCFEVFEDITFFKSQYPEPGFLHNVPNRPHTKYEKGFRKEGRDIFYLMFTNKK